MGHENEILDLIYSSADQAAPYITHKLSTIGDGTMAEGIHAIAQFAAKTGIEYGKKNGLRNGVIIGTGGTLMVVFSILAIQSFHKERIERVRALKDADRTIKVADAKIESTQDAEEQLSDAEVTEYIIEEGES